MRAFAVILAKSELILASFLKLKIHKAEMANFVTFFVYALLLGEKISKIAIDNSVENLMLRIFKKHYSKSVEKYDL